MNFAETEATVVNSKRPDSEILKAASMNHSFLKTVFSVFQRAVLFFVGQFSSKIFEKNRKTVTCNSDFSFKINIIIYETINWLILQLLRK